VAGSNPPKLQVCEECRRTNPPRGTNMSIKAFGFDHGGVLAGIPGPVFMRGAADVLRVHFDELRDVYFAHNHLVNREGVSWDEFWPLIARALDREERIPELNDYVRQDGAHTPAGRKPNKEVLDLVDRLRAGGYLVGLLSNNTHEVGTELRDEGLDRHFDAFLISEEIGAMKPSREAYERLCATLGVKADELAMVDDSPQALSSAQEVGYTAILFEGYEKLLDSLTGLGVTFR